MKLKFITSLLVASVIVGAAGSLSSCKDTDNDLYLQLKDENATIQERFDQEIALLNAQLADMKTAYETLKAQQAACKADCQAALNAAIEQLRKDIEAKKYVTKPELDAALENYLTITKFNEFKAQYDILAGNVATMAATIETIEKTLGEDAAGKYETVAERFTALESALATLEDAVETMQGDITTLTTNYNTLSDDLANTKTDLQTLQGTVDGLSTDVETLKTDLAGVNSQIEAINTRLDGIDALITSVQADATEALNKANANEGRLDAMDDLLEALGNDIIDLQDKDLELAQDIAANTALIQQLSDDLDAYKDEAAQNLQDAKDALEQKINALETALTDRIGDVEDAVSQLSQDLKDLEKRVKANEDKIETIEDSLDKLTNRVSDLENRISSLVIQEVSNPVTGCVNLPINVQTMILFNYVGETTSPVRFPDFAPHIGTNFGKTVIIDDPDAFFQGDYFTLPAGQMFMNNDNGNMGKIYFTINPANIDLTGKEFYIVNSLDQVSPIKLTDVKPCSKLLTFGISRTETSPNGFYEANATIEVTDIPLIRINHAPGLKADLKAAIKERSLYSVVDIAKILYKQFDGKFPALGVKAAWEEDGKPQAVYSQYGIAATSFQPLSYGFLDGQDLSGYFPSMPNLDSLLDFDFSLNVPTIHFDFEPITIETPNVNFTLNVNTDFTIELDAISTTVTVVVPSQEVDVYDDYHVKVGTAVVPEQTVTATGSANLNETATEINEQLKDKFERLFSDLEDDIRNQMYDAIDDLVVEVNEKINANFQKVMDDIEEKVNSSIADVVDQLQGQLNDKIESITDKFDNYYSRLESAYKHINWMIEDPNHYLQVTMLYSSTGDGIGRLSNSKALPSQWGGTGTAVTLIPTTINGEILSPAFQKFVAVSNVYDQNGNDCTTSAKCRQIRDDANASQYMNTVVPGERRTIAFDFSSARNAAETYTFEIFYQALDYHGYTSTQTFYVTIK